MSVNPGVYQSQEGSSGLASQWLGPETCLQSWQSSPTSPFPFGHDRQATAKMGTDAYMISF